MRIRSSPTVIRAFLFAPLRHPSRRILAPLTHFGLSAPSTPFSTSARAARPQTNTPMTTPHMTPRAFDGNMPYEDPYSPNDTDLELLTEAGIDVSRVLLRRNAVVAQLYEDAIRYEGAAISSSGALINFSGTKTGRSPKDKRIVYEETSKDDIWWGKVNIKMDEHTFEINRARAVDYLNTRDIVYIVDGYAGWDPRYRIKVRVICARAYHALFMRNMLVRPPPEEIQSFGEPDFTIYNAGAFPANRYTTGMTSETSVGINFKRMEMVVLGTEYAGEMKKGVFSLMHYLQPAKFGQLSLHAAANVGKEKGDVSLFFGLSGTGKTTLSADSSRSLIGDDEHVWSSSGVFNIEGGCYAKTLGLSSSREPAIHDAISFGALLENVVYDPSSRECDFYDASVSENGRCAYPIDSVEGALVPCVTGGESTKDGHPKNVLMLTCDAYGVLPPVSRLTPEQASYHFLAGYTSKTPGTEDGVVDPIPTFSTCYSAPFLVLHPSRYAAMLADQIKQHGTSCWLVNTGWVGGRYGLGSRIPLEYTRAIVDAIHSGALDALDPDEWTADDVFQLAIPKRVPGVPSELLDPSRAWADEDAFERERMKLARLFVRAFGMFEDDHRVSKAIKQAGPIIH